MTTLQQQARALGDPTRHAIFRYIADGDGPADVAEITAHFGLNHNAIRQHLAELSKIAGRSAASAGSPHPHSTPQASVFTSAASGMSGARTAFCPA